MENEILLTGGRITQGVVRIGNHVHRPQCENAGFIHTVLEHLAEKEVPYAPQFLGVDAKGREILTYMEGDVPGNLVEYSMEQCAVAARIIRGLHDALASLPEWVVLPEPCRPHIIMTHGGRLGFANRAAPPPIKAVSSSLTILMTICAGVRLSITAWPTARSLTFATKSFATL